jgi:hypothetical protein
MLAESKKWMKINEMCNVIMNILLNLNSITENTCTEYERCTKTMYTVVTVQVEFLLMGLQSKKLQLSFTLF